MSRDSEYLIPMDYYISLEIMPTSRSSVLSKKIVILVRRAEILIWSSAENTVNDIMNVLVSLSLRSSCLHHAGWWVTQKACIKLWPNYHRS